MEDTTATFIALIFAVWVTFALYRITRIVVGYAWLRRIQQNARPWSRPGVVLSDEVSGPIAAGFLHPVIVLPASLPEQLTDVELEHVLLHEEAHIARRDQWANLLARIIGVVFGLHPVAALALHHIERERERACDDWVVAATGDAKPYAASLTRVFELTRRGDQPDLASGFMGSRLGGRIEELLTQGRQFTQCVSIPMLAAIVLPLAIMAGLGLRAPATVAYAQEKQPARPVAQATPATTPAKPAIPVTRAPAQDAAADRLEALLTRLEAMLDRMTQSAPREATLDFLKDRHLGELALENELRAAEAQMKAEEQVMRDQQRQLERQAETMQRQLEELRKRLEQEKKF
jgi:hypothetical protein